MKLAYIHMCGFRGFQKPIRIDFSPNFTIIDGRNGVGKSTIFDAVEFALTGTISKYLDARADRESVEDYLWWAGQNDNRESLSNHFVEVGFRSEKSHFELRRTPLDPKNRSVSAPTDDLFEPEFAPKQAISQLCASTIIRDEHIARLSLDLKEADRFKLLRNAIGAVDAEDWIKRAQALSAAAANRLKSATAELEQAKASLASAVRQIDQARAALPADSLVAQAAARLQRRMSTSAPPDQLPNLARRRLAEIESEASTIRTLAQRYEEMARVRVRLSALQRRVEEAREAVAIAQQLLNDRAAAIGDRSESTVLSEQARQLETLAHLGQQIDLRDGRCPLCESAISHDQFEHGVAAALALARQLDSQAVDLAGKERARDEAQRAFAAAEEAHSRLATEYSNVRQLVDTFDKQLESASLTDTPPEDIQGKIARLDAESKAIVTDLGMVDTISLDHAIGRASQESEEANERLRRAESRLGRARRAEARAKAIYDAARRAAAETLDQRLDRILPLMSELYKRLRPHPVWTDIEYSIRGDVQRFLKLQVGDDVNPQFVFSSGQRRATGLAFLLSVNLSIAWSRWRSILLDDPVQHVDDFRTVHLAEVLAHLCASGRQIVCAVEDRALADLMCRRLPASETAPAKRVTLGTDSSGVLAIVDEQRIAPPMRHALVLQDQSLSA
jgi:energy-coupling factor transporter ATP-binding protein EcfA2